MRRCTIIVNPTSGSFSTAVLAGVEQALRAADFEVTTKRTGAPGDAAAFARAACREEVPPVVVAAGGDGTVADVVNGFVPGTGTFAVLPMGTSNVLAREIGIRSVEDGIARIVRGRTRSCSVGLVTRSGVRRYFTLMAGIGFDGAVVESVRLAEKRLFHQGAYILAALRLFLRWDGSMLQVSDGERSLSCHSMVACNGSRYGGSFILAPRADIFSSSLEVVCLPDRTRIGYLKTALRLLRGAVVSGHCYSAQRLLVSGEKPVQTDGDYLCAAPVTIEAVPDFANIIV